MSFTGMDTSAVRSLATQMTHASCEIQQLTNQLTSQLQNAGWVGPDRESFVSSWQSDHMTRLHQVVNALNDAAQCANRNATEQDHVSQSV